ncbi:MAG: hypothetical protein V1794_03065 [Candidatus Glassbacteria bacterium]
MTKFLQFIGGFILSFMLIIGLFTGIIWYTKEYSAPPPPQANIDSLLAAGVLPDSLSVYAKDQFMIQQQKDRLEVEKLEQARKAEELAQRQAVIDSLQATLRSASAEEDSVMNKQYTEVAKLLESMKPLDAGKVMDQMPEFSAAKILTRMGKRQAGRVMNAMQPDRVAKVNQLIILIKE